MSSCVFCKERPATWTSPTGHEACDDCRSSTVPAEMVDAARRLGEAVDTFGRWLHLPDSDLVVLVLGATAANLLEGDALWLLVVGPPGAGKTEVLQPLTTLEYVHPAATITEAALLSGSPRKSHEPGATGGLLREVGDFGIVVAKDFSGVLSMHRDSRAAVLAALREIFDGSWSRPVGTGGGRVLTWKGKAGLIGGVTPSVDRHAAVMGALGERFVLYRISDDTSASKADRALANFGDEKQMRTELAVAVEKVMANLDVDYRGALDDADRARIVALAEFAVRARTAVERDGYRRTVQVMPEYEQAPRLAKQLAQLRAGIGAVGADPKTAWRIVRKVALDSIPRLRWQILTTLHDTGEPMKTADLVETTGIPKRTLDEYVEDLELLKLVDRTKTGPATNSPWIHALAAEVRDNWPEVGEKRQRESEGSPSLDSPSPLTDISRPLVGEEPPDPDEPPPPPEEIEYH